MPADDTDFDFSSDRGNNPRLLEIIRLDQRRDEARRAEMSTAIGLKGPIWDELAELDGVVRYDRPHLGVLRSAIYYLWKYLPRHMGSPDRFSTYYVMGLTVGVDTDRLGPNDPQRKFIRRMSVEQCLALAKALLEDPGGNPSRFNPLALLHRSGSHVKEAVVLAGLIQRHIEDESGRHVLVYTMALHDKWAQDDAQREQKRKDWEKARKAKEATSHIERTERDYDELEALARRFGRRHAENHMAHKADEFLPYPYRCGVGGCRFVSAVESGLHAHLVSKHQKDNKDLDRWVILLLAPDETS
jgi:hypothetical protein